MPDLLFTVPTPLGFSIRTTTQYWALIQRKHPEVVGMETEVQNRLRHPEQVRRSRQDRDVYLFYTHMPPAYSLVVVVKRLDGEGFIATSSLSDKVKEGEMICPISV